MRPLAFLLFVFLLTLPLAAQAQERIYCPLPEDGNWINPDPAPKEISRIEVESECINNSVNVRVRAFTACIPRDCKWGWTRAERRSDGAIKVLLVGFLSSKQLTLKSFRDFLDARVVDIKNEDGSITLRKTYNLQRK